MGKLICLQSGHEGVTTGATGAPGEQELNVRIRNKLSEILISKGFVLQLVNANPTDAEINKDYDLFLALHGDANIYGTGGGCVAYIDPAWDSSAESNAKSKAIKEAIESEYFNRSGIVNHPERINVNMTRYYMWKRLSANTQCVIIEMGVVQDAHDKVILADTDRVANALARGICKAFGVAFDPPVYTPDYKAMYEESEKNRKQISVLLTKANATIASLKEKVSKIIDELKLLI